MPPPVIAANRSTAGAAGGDQHLRAEHRRRSRPPRPNTANCGPKTPWRWTPTPLRRRPPPKLTPFTEPPQTTNDRGHGDASGRGGLSRQHPGRQCGVSRERSGQHDHGDTGATGRAGTARHRLHRLLNELVNTVLRAERASLYTALYNAVKVPLGLTTRFNDIGLLINFPVSQWLKFAPHAALRRAPERCAGGRAWGVGFGRGTLFSEVRGGMGNAGTLVGKLSVPPSWASATPAIRTVAAALSAAGPDAVPAAALGEGGLLSSMSVAGMLGSAMGAGGPTVVRAGVRGRMTPIKDLKDKHSPEQLKRLVAQISEKPESVQHHNVDQEGLDALLEQLAKKPGIHAVHLKKRLTSPRLMPSEALIGASAQLQLGMRVGE